MSADERRERQLAAGKRWRDKNRAKVTENNAKFYAQNREREKARAQEWRLANKDHCKEVTKAWRASNEKHFASVQRAWERANPEKVKANKSASQKRNRPAANARNSAYMKRNPDKINAMTKSRQRRVRQSTPAWADLRNIRAMYMSVARVSRCLGIEFHLDHYYPIRSDVVCGLHCEQNLRLLPGTLNRRKRNSLPLEN